MNAGLRLLVLACLPLAACSSGNPGTGDDDGAVGTDAEGGRDGEDGGRDGPDDSARPDADGDADAVTDDAGVSDYRETTGRDDAGPDETPADAIGLPAACGDGWVDPGEECDDGNRLDGDGCDFMCRLGDAPFAYPPPDPDSPVVEPGGPPSELTDAGELSSSAAVRVSGWPCQPVRLAGGADRFALAYDHDQPDLGTRLRILDRTGRTVGAVWDRETPWELFALALFPTDEGFGLLSGSFTYGIQRSRFRADGTPSEEFLTLRGPRGIYDPWDSLTGGAWAPGRWLAAGSLYGTTYRGWLLQTFDEDGRPVATATLPQGEAGLCVDAVRADAGFAVGDGRRVVLLDEDLRALAWTGVLSETWSGGVMGLASDGFWVAWYEYHELPRPRGSRDVWVDFVEADGTPRFPPRRVVTGRPRPSGGGGTTPGGDIPDLAIADGPGGAAVTYWEGLGGDESGGPVLLLTVDDWGNVITPATPVLAEGDSTTIGWVQALAADGGGYGVVVMQQGAILGTGRLVFRYFQPVP